MSVDTYAGAGRDVEVPRARCPLCASVMTLWSGYWRSVRSSGLCRKIFVQRARCRECRATHVLLPSFLLTGRLDVAETVGAVLAEVAGGAGGVRPAAERLDIPHTTARGWLRRFSARARRIAVSFAALSVELGGAVVTPLEDTSRFALAAIRAAFRAALALPGWLVVGWFGFVSAVSGGTLIATNTNSPYLMIGNRRFMPPVP
jgi:transposase-like protein